MSAGVHDEEPRQDGAGLILPCSRSGTGAVELFLRGELQTEGVKRIKFIKYNKIANNVLD